MIMIFKLPPLLNLLHQAIYPPPHLLEPHLPIFLVPLPPHTPAAFILPLLLDHHLHIPPLVMIITLIPTIIKVENMAEIEREASLVIIHHLLLPSHLQIAHITPGHNLETNATINIIITTLQVGIIMTHMLIQGHHSGHIKPRDVVKIIISMIILHLCRGDFLNH